MILAAGEGRRLRPLTDALPKALVDVAGVPMLDRVAGALIAAGADRLIVNAHHRADQIEAHLRTVSGYGASWAVSREDAVSDRPLDTGGGLRHAASSFSREAPFMVHNADVLSDLDLRDVLDAHVEGALTDDRIATLVVTRRPTTRPLLVDSAGVLGRANRSEGWEVVARHPIAGATASEAGFCGIHVLSPRIFDLLVERGTFSIMDAYMRLIGRGHVVATYDASGAAWHDIGTPERLAAAERALRGALAG
jgi:NDP-sugar pyrophosphorylase family protein